MTEVKSLSGATKLTFTPNRGSLIKRELMGEHYLRLKYNLKTPVHFEIGDWVYIDRNMFPIAVGGRFEIIETPYPKYNVTNGGFECELEFKAYYLKWANKILFYDRQYAGGEGVWNLTRTPDAHLSIVCSNLASLGYDYNGQAITYSIDESVDMSAKLVSYDSVNIIDALTLIAETWDCEWWVEDNVIHLGRCEYNTSIDLKLGDNVQNMTRSESQDVHATRIYAFGSTRNLTEDYRADDRPDYLLGIGETRLLLPSGTPYVDAEPNMPQEKAVEAVVVFDDVYPRRIGTMSDITTSEGQTVDEEGNVIETWTVFRYKDTGLVFNKDYQIKDTELRITFTSGVLNGMDFAVTFDPDNDGSQLWEIVRNEDYGTPVPNDILKPSAGDTYILYNFDVKMVSDLYVPAAEQELLERAQAYLEKAKIDPSVFSVEMNAVAVMKGAYEVGHLLGDENAAIVLDENGNYLGDVTKYPSLNLEIGDRVNLVNRGFFVDGRESRIRGYEKHIDGSKVTYSVGNTAAYSRLKTVEGEIKEITYQGNVYTSQGGSSVYIIGTNDTTTPTDRNVFSAARGNLEYGRKAVNDVISGAWTFKKKQTFESGLQIGKSYASGITGFGGYVDENANLEVESVKSRRFIETPEFRFNSIEINLGDKWRAPGGGLIESVDTANKEITLKLEEGQIGAVRTGAICMGIFHSITSSDNATSDTDDSKGNRTYAGFYTCYFTITEITESSNNSKFKYQLRPQSTNWPYSFEPSEAMRFVVYGSFTDEDWQTSVYETRTYSRMLWKQNTWEIGVQNIAMQDGDLSNLKVHGMDMTGYSMYLNNVYFTGTITQVKPDGTPVLTANDLGDWKAGHYDYYDRVSHNGSLWLVINEDGTDDEPSADSPDWLLQVAAGSDGQNGSNGQDGKDGQDGQDGKDGVGVARVDVEYAISASNTVAPTTGWQTTSPEWQSGMYIWSRTLTVYTDSTSTYSDAVCISGGDGAEGKGISSIIEQYYLSTSPTSLVGGSWSTVAPSWTPGNYIWTRSTITYTDNTTSTSEPICVTGNTGQSGENGISVSNVGEWYDGISIPYLGLVRIGNATYQCINPDGVTSTYQGLADENSAGLLDENSVILSGGDIDLSDFELIAQDGQSGADGQNGTDGKDGADGVGVAKVDVEYAISSSKTVAPTDGWQSVAPTWQEGMYIWSRTLTVYTNNTYSYSDAVCISGEDGNGLASVIEQYYLSTSPIYLNGGSWTNTAPTWTSGNYIWTRSIITYTNGNTATTDAICVTGNQGEKGQDGKDGTDGIGVSAVDVLYTISASNTIKPTTGWQTTPPTWEDGKYIWSKTQITYTNNTTVETNAVCITGGTGATGASGNGVVSIAEEYYLSTSATELAGGSWSQTPPTWENGKYIWTRSTITYTNGNKDTTQPICVTGDKGDSITNVGEWYEGLFIPYLGIVRIGNASYMCVNKDGSTAAYAPLADELSAALLDENNSLLSAGDIDLSDFMLVAHDGSDGQNGQDGQDGENGNDGVSIVSTKMEYYLSSSPTELIGDSWSTTYPAWQSGYYLWTRQTVYYDNDTNEVHDPICVSGGKGEDGKDGTDGKDGAQGLQGCILRDSEWTLGTEYRNDELLTSGTRYIDVALVRDNSTALGWRAYKCLQTHTSTADFAPGNTAYWEEFSAQFVSIFTSLILAKNASIEFISSNQLVVKDEDNNATAGISGSTAGGKIRIWAGSSDPDTAPFRVNEAGEFVATNASITGTINATSGTIGGFTIASSLIQSTIDEAMGYRGASVVTIAPSYFNVAKYSNTSSPELVGRAAIGSSAVSSATGIVAYGFFENKEGGAGIIISVKGGLAGRVSSNAAIYCTDGYYCGFRLYTTRVSASTTLTNLHSIVLSIASSDITLTLPESPQAGQVYFIRKCASGNVNIAVGSSEHKIRGNYSDTSSTSKSLTNGNLAILMWNENDLFWTFNYMGY